MTLLWEKDDKTDEMYGGGVFILDFLLTVAFIAGNVSCSQPAGGNDMGIPPTPQTKPGECVGETIYQGEFGGAQFVGADEDWTYDYITPNTEFDKHYANAINAMNNKVAELQQMVNGRTNSLYKTIDAELKTLTNTENIATNITANYNAIAKIFANFEKNLNGTVELNTYRATYHLLAANAYNKSMGDWENATALTTNKEMKDSDISFFFESELDNADLDYEQVINHHQRWWLVM